jgi:hypothetical protein
MAGEAEGQLSVISYQLSIESTNLELITDYCKAIGRQPERTECKLTTLPIIAIAGASN